MTRFTISLVVLGLLAGLATTQETKKIDKSPSMAGVGPADVEVLFINGSLLRMLVQSEKLEIATEYGRLTVPMTDVRSIEFGLRFPEGVSAKIQNAILDLGGSNSQSRDKAVATLLEFGPYAYPAVLPLMKSKDLEVSRRAKDIVKHLEKKHAKKDLKTSEDDKIATKAFSIVGRILTPTLKSKTELFGEVELHLSKMGTLKAIAAPGQSAEVTVVVDAAQYANGDQWLETAIELDGRTPLTVTAKGVVDTWPQQPNQWVCGPNGAQGGRMVINGGGGLGNIILGGGGGIPGQAGRAGRAQMQINGGALFGKIGETGEPFLLGERYQATPAGEGKLYLAIAPSPWGCPSAGNFEVKIAR